MTRLRAGLLLAFVAGALLVAPSAHAAVAVDRDARSAAPLSTLKAMWGPSTLPDGSSAFPLYKDLGVDILQNQLLWDQVALRRPDNPRDPSDPAYLWPQSLDRAIADGQANGIRSALMVRNAPQWANGERGPFFVPRDARDFGDFLIAAAKRYPTVRHWMVWGEPTRLGVFEPMRPRSPDGPEAYAILLDRAYGALKSVRKSNIVIGGMTVTIGVQMPARFLRWMRLPNGKPPRLDWYGHNPYSRRFPDLRKQPYVKELRDFSDLDTFIREIRRTYRRSGRKPKLWLSEFTISSDRNNRAFNFHTTRKGQARWLTTAYRIARRQNYIAGLGWFNLIDEPNRVNGLTTGLLTADGRKKPAYDAYKRVP